LGSLSSLARLQPPIAHALRIRTVTVTEANHGLIQKNAENVMFVTAASHPTAAPARGFGPQIIARDRGRDWIENGTGICSFLRKPAVAPTDFVKYSRKMGGWCPKPHCDLD
jgi:hypothetical protein